MSAESERLVSDLKLVARDAEELLKVTAGDMSEKAQQMRTRLTATLEKTRESCRHLEAKALETAKASDRVVRAHPYESIGVAFGVGLLLGVLITRGEK